MQGEPTAVFVERKGSDLQIEGVPNMKRYVYVQTDWIGDWTKWSCSATSAEAANNFARGAGWTPPRWWQFWRNNDYPRNWYTE